MRASSSLISTALAAAEIQALLGSSGMASAYCDLDHNLPRPVVKMLSATLAADRKYVDRFRERSGRGRRMENHVYEECCFRAYPAYR